VPDFIADLRIVGEQVLPLLAEAGIWTRPGSTLEEIA
jgi:hypothetical protein